MKRYIISILFLLLLLQIDTYAQKVVGTPTSSHNTIYRTFAMLKADAEKWPVNTVITSLGYYQPGDEGGASYLIASDTVAGYAVDTFAVIYLSPNKYLKLLPKQGVNANAFALDYVGTSNNEKRIEAAIKYGTAIGVKTINFYGYGTNRFNITAQIDVSQDSMHLVGHSDFKLTFNSRVFNAFYFLEANYTRIEKINVAGIRDSTFGHNAAFFIENSRRFYVDGCNAIYAKLFHGQNRTVDTMSTVYIQNCINTNFFGANAPGSGYYIQNCMFIQSDSTVYDDIGDIGTAHAIYGFADRRNIVIEGCMFKNIRQDAIKMSGSSGHINNVIIRNNTFEDCGSALDFGGDAAGDHQHSNLLFDGNIIRNCYGRRIGWTSTESTFRLYACDNVMISNNTFSYSHYPSNIYYRYTIRINPSGKVYMGNISIENNRFVVVDVNNNPLVPGLEGQPIYISGVGGYSPSTIKIKGNVMERGFMPLIDNSCHVIVEDNVINGVVFAQFNTVAHLDVRNNTYFSHEASSADVSVIYTRVGWLNDVGNKHIGKTVGKPNGWAVTYNGPSQAKIPISANSGVTWPTKGKPVAGFWYGADWNAGDSLVVNGVSIKYPTHFTSDTSLIAYINSTVPNRVAFDLGDSLGIGRTGFIIVQVTGTAPIANPTTGILIRTQSNLAGYVSMAGERKISGGTDYFANYKGGGDMNKVVVFSPYLTQQSVVVWEGFNATSNTFLTTNGMPFTPKSFANKPGIDGTVEFTLPVEPVGTERFVYKIL